MRKVKYRYRRVINTHVILHITPEREWQRAVEKGAYRPSTMDREGFIHCSTPAQATAVANTLFREQKGLVLFVINPERVKAPVIYEDLYKTGEVFPHIYGELNLDAVCEVLDFEPDQNGLFRLPSGVLKLTER